MISNTGIVKEKTDGDNNQPLSQLNLDNTETKDKDEHNNDNANKNKLFSHTWVLEKNTNGTHKLVVYSDPPVGVTEYGNIHLVIGEYHPDYNRFDMLADECDITPPLNPTDNTDDTGNTDIILILTTLLTSCSIL